jgi:uncharacterized membrane protein
MLTVILRSVCCGIAALVMAAFSGTFIALWVGSYFAAKNVRPGGGEVGWDLVSLYHNTASSWLLLPLLVFAIGFFIGFRHFSKSLATK